VDLPGIPAWSYCAWAVVRFGAVYALLLSLVLAEKAPGQGTKSPLREEIAEKSPIEVRLGFVSNVYAVTVQQALSYQRLFEQVPPEGNRPFRAHVASGTSGEVLSWLDSGRIDMAVLSPTMYAEVLRVDPRGRHLHTACRYLATEGLAPAPDYEWVSADRKKKGQYHFSYRSVCLVPQESDLNTFADLKKAFEAASLQFLFVDRLSVSGHLALRHALLEKASLRVPEDQICFTYSHLASLEALAKWKKGDGGKVPVAFVFDETEMPKLAREEARKAFKRVKDFPGLNDDDYLIPQNVWVAGPRFEYADKLKTFLQEHENKSLAGAHDFANRGDNAQDKNGYTRVRKWASDLNVMANKPQFVTLDEIHSLLAHYRSEHGAKDSPRLALVLSGGGAKCAYQVGALEVVERKIGDDIGLVAGTSGGALNAVPVALGVTAKYPGRLADVWLNLDLLDIARPSALVRTFLGLWVASVVIFLVGIARWVSSFWSWPWGLLGVAPVLLALLAALLTLFVLSWVSSEWIDRRDSLRYTQILLAFGYGKLVMPVALALGLLLWWAGTHPNPTTSLGSRRKALLARWQAIGYPAAKWLLALPTCAAWLALRLTESADQGLSESDAALSRRPILARYTLAAAAFALLPVFTILSLVYWSGGTLFQEADIERAYASHFADLTRGEVGTPEVDLSAPLDVLLPDLSERMVEKIKKNPRKRDLVITGSALSGPEGGVTDRYFCIPAEGGRLSQFKTGKAVEMSPLGARAVDLTEQGKDHDYPKLLLGVVRGSGTLFPGFPPVIIKAFPTNDSSVSLIDGGFVHNSPVEAAVQWGASHIILIEAAPRSLRATEKERGTAMSNQNDLLQNTGEAFNYLFDQAQLSDVRSRKKVAIFVLRPDGQNFLGLMDFCRGKIRDAIETGRNDAAGARFEWQYGEPHFLTIR
jgi:predicted acylesterase/phospholipase RssA/ABC-type phosphate/phosphonate transport system substrate-binding protein